MPPVEKLSQRLVTETQSRPSPVVSPPVVPAGGSSSVGTANPVGSDGPVVAGSPIGPCEVVLVGGDDGLPRVGEALSFPDAAGGSLPVVPAGGGGGGVLLSGYCEPCGLRWTGCCR